MNIHPSSKKAILTGSIFLGLAVLIGAFGAHGLKNMVSADKLVTFETGVRYHFYHGFALLFLGLVKQNFQNLKIELSYYAFLVGILLFSFNCYFYVISDIKTFALIVPLGGVLFALGWFNLSWKCLKLR